VSCGSPRSDSSPHLTRGNKLYTDEVFDLLLRSLKFVDITRGTSSGGDDLSVVTLVFNKGAYTERGILSSNEGTNRLRMAVNLETMLKKKCPYPTDVLMDLAIITVETRAGLEPQQYGSIVDGKIVSDSERKYNEESMGEGDENSEYGDRGSSMDRHYGMGDNKDDYYRDRERDRDRDRARDRDRMKQKRGGHDDMGYYERGKGDRGGRGKGPKGGHGKERG
jgi:hypothetical protein